MNSLTHRAVLAMGFMAMVVLALGIGYLTPNEPYLALSVALLVLLLGTLAAEPAAVALAAMPIVPVVYRVDLGGLDLSASDVALAGAAASALIFAPRPFSPALRNLLWANAFYQFATLFTVLLNPFTANTVEWIHAWLLISGSLMVGWTIGRRGRARLGMTLFLMVCLVIAGSTIAQGVWQWARGDTSAVYTAWPYAMHKNMVGCLLGFAALVVFVRPQFLGWSRLPSWAALAAFLSALVFTQSRQAVVALSLAAVYVAYRRGIRGRVLLATVVIPVLIFVGSLVQDQFDSGNQFNSANARIVWLGQAYDGWLAAPWVGYGLRFWNSPNPGLDIMQPPNAELEVLASAGLLGLIGFVVWWMGTLTTLTRVSSEVGILATALVGSRLVQGQFDIFWVGVQTSVPFVIAGVCLGALELAAQSPASWGRLGIQTPALQTPITTPVKR